MSKTTEDEFTKDLSTNIISKANEGRYLSDSSALLPEAWALSYFEVLVEVSIK